MERTVPFGFLVQSLVVVWYTQHGYHPDDLASRRAGEPWYDHKSTPALEEMLHKLRDSCPFAQVSPTHT